MEDDPRSGRGYMEAVLRVQGFGRGVVARRTLMLDQIRRLLRDGTFPYPVPEDEPAWRLLRECPSIGHQMGTLVDGLNWAAETGDRNTMRLLLDGGVDVDCLRDCVRCGLRERETPPEMDHLARGEAWRPMRDRRARSAAPNSKHAQERVRRIARF